MVRLLFFALLLYITAAILGDVFQENLNGILLFIGIIFIIYFLDKIIIHFSKKNRGEE